MLVHVGEEGDDWRAGTQWRPASATLLWTHHALKAMDEDLQRRYGPGARIACARGEFVPTLRRWCHELGAGSIIANRRYEPVMKRVDKYVQEQLAADGFEVSKDLCPCS
jgi:deoxyribodipyrimidine photo-lyase